MPLSGWGTRLEIGGGEKTGLQLAPSAVLLVPGNHDAYNFDDPQTGSVLDRWKKSLRNYNAVFVERPILYPPGCYYDWVETGQDSKDPRGVYMAVVDSCFLGDPDDSPRSDVRRDQLIAKGKLRIDQSERLLEWYDCGVRGALAYPGDTERKIG